MSLGQLDLWHMNSSYLKPRGFTLYFIRTCWSLPGHQHGNVLQRQRWMRKLKRKMLAPTRWNSCYDGAIWGPVGSDILEAGRQGTLSSGGTAASMMLLGPTSPILIILKSFKRWLRETNQQKTMQLSWKKVSGQNYPRGGSVASVLGDTFSRAFLFIICILLGHRYIKEFFIDFCFHHTLEHSNPANYGQDMGVSRNQ